MFRKKLKQIVIILLCLTVFNCGSDDTIQQLNTEEADLLETFQNIEANSRLTIADDTEPGQKLELCLTYIDKATKQILKGQSVKFYHTSNSGDYEPQVGNDETTARLSGTAITDDDGRIYIRTILPGNYASDGDNRHIHTDVKGARPETYDIHFKQYTGFMGTNFVNGSDQHFLADLKFNRDSTLVIFMTVEVKRPQLND